MFKVFSVPLTFNVTSTVLRLLLSIFHSGFDLVVVIFYNTYPSRKMLVAN